MLESENGYIIPRTIGPKPRVSGLHLNATRSFPWKIASELAWMEPTKRPSTLSTTASFDHAASLIHQLWARQ